MNKESKGPHFLVIGAQKSGTTTLFALLRKHPNLFLPLQKEIEFFSNDQVYSNGFDWYLSQYFRGGSYHGLGGEVSPQYMSNYAAPKRIYEHLPNIKLIAILRHPIERAYSHYLMSTRRGIEDRDFVEAFEAAKKDFYNGKTIPGSKNYFRYSLYSDILDEYLKYFPRENILIVSQSTLSDAPEEVLHQISEFLQIENIIPENVSLRLHTAGKVKFQWLHDLLKKPSIVRKVLKNLLPLRYRSAIKFWLEQFNIVKEEKKPLSESVLAKYEKLVHEQELYLKREFNFSSGWLNR